jgi:hypothetical protein
MYRNPDKIAGPQQVQVLEQQQVQVLEQQQVQVLEQRRARMRGAGLK